MVKALTEKVFPYVLKKDRNVDSPTVFHLRRLTARERASLEDEIATGNASGAIGFRTGSNSYRACRVGIEGWECFDGMEFEAESAATDILGSGVQRRLVTDECLDALQSAYITELAEAIREGQKMKDDEAGN